MNNQRVEKIEYGSFGARLLALLIDTIILIPVSALSQGLFHSLFIEAVFGILISGVYYVLFLSGGWQATPGKRLVGLFVTSEHGAPLDKRQATLRYLAYMMPALPIYSSLEPNVSGLLVMWLLAFWFIPVLLTKQRTGVHDLLAETRVRVGRID